MRERTDIEMRWYRLRLQFLAGENQSFAAPEYSDGARLIVCGRFESLLNHARVLREIEGVDAQTMILGIGQIDPDAVACHDTTDIGANLAKHIAKVEVGDHAVCQVEQKFQALTGFARGLKIHVVVHGHGNLARNDSTEAHFLGRISVAANA